ncbi:monooxygenase [Xylaria sp. CBS 124048]|nr:monooxygenase [Xylaria sp. CBS 124048]
MSQSKPAPIAIVGAGPCGLTFARLLELAGIDYVVFERDSSAEPKSHHQGGTLDVHPGTGQAALEAAGLKDGFEKLARREADVFTIQDFEGCHRYTTGGEGEGDRPEIDRRQLRDLLLDSLSKERVHWGKALKAVESDVTSETTAARWVLRFADGSSESGFRLVVGADGAWSKVRPLITPIKPTYSGKMYIEGRITHSNPQYAAAVEMVGPGNSAATGHGRILMIQQMFDRTYRMYAGIKGPESIARSGGILDFEADAKKSRAALLELFADFAPHLRAFIETAEGPWRVWPLYTSDAELFSSAAEGKIWIHTPGVTLLGDAAHVALPNGEGVNMAMLDALRLFECLVAEIGKQEKVFDSRVDAEAIERAVVAYETEMRQRASEHIEDGIEMNDMLFQADGAQRMIAMFQQFAETAQR